MRIATIYDSTARPDTIGIYVDRALEMLGHEVCHIEPLKEGIPKGHDLYLMVDDGIPYELEEKPGLLAYWAIDTHISMGNQILKGKDADYIFAAQKNGAEELSKIIGKDVYWLPLACDPDIHSFPYFGDKKYDVCFIGNVRPGLMDKRIDHLDALFNAFPNFYYGQMDYRRMAEKYAESKIVFNCSINNDINMRCFEAMCSGSLLLTDKIKDNGFEELFGDGCVVYDGIEDMLEKARYYIDHEEERNKITKVAIPHIHINHTYEHRMEKIIDIINGGSK